LVEEDISKADLALDRFLTHTKQYTHSSAMKLALPPAIGIVVISLVTYFSTIYFHTDSIILLSFFYIFVRFVQACTETFTGLGEIKFISAFFKELYLWQTQLESKTLSREDNVSLSPRVVASVKERFDNTGISIVLEKVSFRYPNAGYVLKDMNFRLNKGDCLLISGESGAGKSTLLSLILGINSPTGGQIMVNGFHVDKVRTLLFSEIAYVGPEPYLLVETVKDNLLYGNKRAGEISNSEILDALKAANAFDFVFALPSKENTFLNEFAKISTGQKQRLSIARAILRKPKILVLDECTSNLDSQNEAEIIKSLIKLKPSLTIIVVSHRPAFRSIASHVINLPINNNELPGLDTHIETDKS